MGPQMPTKCLTCFHRAQKLNRFAETDLFSGWDVWDDKTHARQAAGTQSHEFHAKWRSICMETRVLHSMHVPRHVLHSMSIPTHVVLYMLYSAYTPLKNKITLLLIP